MNEGTTISLEDFAGQVVVLNVWGQWCAPCRGEADDLEEVYEQTKDLGVQFLGINVRDNQQRQGAGLRRSTAGRLPVDLRPVDAVAAGARAQLSDVGRPTTVVLDREHRVAAVFLTELLAERSATGRRTRRSRSGRGVDRERGSGAGMLMSGLRMRCSPPESATPSRTRRSPVRCCWPSARACSPGLVSFASPCVVPLVPGYLSYLAGVVGAEAPAVTADQAGARTTKVRDDGRLRVAGAAATVRRRLHRRLRARDGVGVRGDLGARRQPRTAHAHRRRRHDRHGTGVHRARFRPCRRDTRSRAAAASRAWPALRCSARCSRSAGPRASARRWPGSSRSRPAPKARPLRAV